MTIYPKRLLKGIAYTCLTLFIIFHEFGTNSLGSEVKWKQIILEWADKQSGFLNALTYVFVFLAMVATLIYLVKGVYFLCTMHIEKNPVFEVPLSVMFGPVGYDGNGSDMNNINKIKQYRDSNLSTMMTSDAAEEYKSTAWLDGMASNPGKHTQSTIDYINSALAGKTNEEGYQWLKK